MGRIPHPAVAPERPETDIVVEPSKNHPLINPCADASFTKDDPRPTKIDLGVGVLQECRSGRRMRAVKAAETQAGRRAKQPKSYVGLAGGSCVFGCDDLICVLAAVCLPVTASRLPRLRVGTGLYGGV